MPDIRFPNMYRVDMEKGPAIKQLHQMFMGDKAANRIGAYLFQGDAAVSPGGNCSGTAILNDGSTVALTGTVAGNEVYIDLPPGCYAVPGPIQVYVLWTNGTVATTVVAGFGTVTRTETSAIIDPGTIIPSVAQLISDIADAVASIPADYSSLLTTIAPEFSTTADYHAGDFVWHGGALYRAREHVSAGTWNQAKFEPVIVSGGLPCTIGGNNALELIGATQSASQFLYYDVGEALAGHVGETITVSFDLMGTVAREIRVYPYQNIGVSIADTVRVTPSVGAFSRVSFTTTVTDYGGSGNHAGRIGLYDEAGAQTLTTRRFKIELGHVSTPWAMSAQDAVIAAQAIAEEASAAIAPVEGGTTASRNYAIGDWLIWKNALYKATATIASGDLLAVGTNLAAGSVSAEVATVKTDLAKASAGLLTPEQALTKRTYIQNGSFSYSSRTVEIQDGVITYTGRASGGTNWITIFISGSFSTYKKGIAEVVPPVSSCLPIALLDSVTHLQLYRETNVPGSLWLAVFFCSVDENENVSVLHVVRPAMAIAEGAGPLKTVGPLPIPEGTTHFAIGFYSTMIADLRNTTTKVIPLFRTFPANE